MPRWSQIIAVKFRLAILIGFLSAVVSSANDQFSHQKEWFKFYCGWRNGGNFGMQLKISARKTVPLEKPKPAGPGSERK